MSLQGVEDIYPLSATQAGMVYHSLATPEAGVYTGQVCFLLNGALSADLMRTTWEQLVGRHAVLRTAILWDDLEEPLQVVQEKVELPWDELDWSGLSASEQEQAFSDFKQKDRQLGFDLIQAPLMRLTLIRLSDERHWLVWTSHHAIADGWSVSAILNEMAALYRSQEAGTESDLTAAFPYNRYIAWLKGQDLDKAEVYWRDTLAGFNQPVPLRMGSPARVSDGEDNHQVTHLSLDATLSKAIAQASRDYQVSLFTLMQSAWGVLLSRYLDKNDIVFGVTTSGRPAQLTGIESAVGLFLNTLPVRQRIDDQQSTASWLKDLQADAKDFLAHETTPLPRVNEWSEVTDGSALFDSILVMTNYPKEYAPDISGLTWSVTRVDVVDHSNYPLALVITPGARIELKLVFDGNLYSPAEADQILRHLGGILQQLVEKPDGRVGELSVPPRDELNALMRDAFTGATLGTDSDSVVQQFETQAANHPQKTAVAIGSDSTSYAELLTSVDDLAGQLKQAGIGPGSRVAISLPSGARLIQCIFAVLKSGAAYIPLDPDAPPLRVSQMLNSAGAHLVLSEGADNQAWQDSNCPVFNLDDGAEGIRARVSETDTGELGGRKDLAYILFTSGSTGTPKGVAISHENLAYSTRARSEYYGNTPESFLLLSAAFFDSSVAGIFWTLCTGGTLVLTEKRAEQDIEGLEETIAKHQVTHTLCLPSLYRALLENASPSALASFKSIILAGEALPADVILEHRSVLPGCGLFNEYGPTEGTVWCSVFDTRDWDQQGPVSIGGPIPGGRLYVLDSQRRPVPPGVAGEICLAGPGVAAGYFNAPEQDQSRFFDDPMSKGQRAYATGDIGRHFADGSVEFLGRLDDQVKIRGYRIELAEIEAALQAHPQVGQAVALVTEMERAASAADADQRISSMMRQLGALDEKQQNALLEEAEALQV